MNFAVPSMSVQLENCFVLAIDNVFPPEASNLVLTLNTNNLARFLKGGYLQVDSSYHERGGNAKNQFIHAYFFLNLFTANKGTMPLRHIAGSGEVGASGTERE